MAKAKREPIFVCLECGKKYYTMKSAQRAMNNRCKCGGTDIDIYVG